ncbi:MAG: 30S ribosomal protein S17 [Patescibacteria group bacterium]
MKESQNGRGKITAKRFTGVVTSNKMIKTIVVRVERKKKHPKYGKFFKVASKFKVDCKDERLYPIGTVVEIIECAPVSKDKKFRVLQSEQKNNLNS